MDLVEARVKNRMTQWALRNLTGIHQTKISLFERGYLVPTELEQEKIASALGFTVDEINWQPRGCNDG